MCNLCFVFYWFEYICKWIINTKKQTHLHTEINVPMIVTLQNQATYKSLNLAGLQMYDRFVHHV